MLRSVSELIDYFLEAEDGEIGRCKDFLFDDQKWTIRYMVADKRKWLPGRKVLISPIALGEPEWSTRRFPVHLTRQQIEGSPSLDEDAPVSRQYEIRWFDYYGWPPYWTGGGLWGAAPYPSALFLKRLEKVAEHGVEPEESHLRSVKEVMGYRIQAVDDDIGHVDDFIVDEPEWILRYIVVDTRKWLPGGKVLVSLSWIESVDWLTRSVAVDLSKEAVKESPRYHSGDPVNRELETRLYDFYGRPKYWE
jgi:hypothetical protein